MTNKFIVDNNVSVLSMNCNILLLKSRIPSELREEGVREFITTLKSYINVSKGEFFTKKDSPLYYLLDAKFSIVFDSVKRNISLSAKLYKPENLVTLKRNIFIDKVGSFLDNIYDTKRW